MKTYSILTGLLLLSICSFAQTITQKIDKAVKQLQADPQMKHATMSLYVVETKTGKPLYALNEQVGLAPASTQKIFTSVAAFELLGKDYKFKTEIGYDSIIEDGEIKGNFYITGYGDPTLGSFRGTMNMNNDFMLTLVEKLKAANIHSINGSIYADASKFEYQPVPGGWIWEDIGNYYGAGCWAINWSENAYSIQLNSGKNIDDSVQLYAFFPPQEMTSYYNNLKSADKGTGDNAYIFSAPYSEVAFLNGTIPVNENKFSIRGSVNDGPYYFLKALKINFDHYKIKYYGDFTTSFDRSLYYEKSFNSNVKVFYTHYSPPLDSINYWFLQKSVNLYGEALIKTIAFEKTGFGATEKGIELLKDFWNKNGIEKSALNIVDGSGLSPQNRVTTDALVKALQYAKDKSWHNSFYNALPTYNGMHMKSGTIGGAKAYTGYHTSKSGTAYTFAIIINNYDSEGGSIVSKMYKVLDELK